MNAVKILIIDDEAALLYALKARLTVEGFNVLTATSAEEGLKILEKEKPEVILLDQILPQMDGLTFLQKVKKENKYSSIPVIMISNISKREDIEKCLKLGAKDYIIKSEFNLETLINKIKEVVAHVPGK